MSPKAEQLIEYNTADVAKIIAEERRCSAAEALEEVYTSKMYRGLSDPETGLYLQSPSYLYELHLMLTSKEDGGSKPGTARKVE